MTIPEIDISGFIKGDKIATAGVYQQVNDALREIGFFTIVGHGIEQSGLSAFSTTAKAFFDMPLAEKECFRNLRNSISRGYVGIGQENLGRTSVGGAMVDVKEQLAFGRFDVPDTPRTTGSRLPRLRLNQILFPTCRRAFLPLSGGTTSAWNF
jgi:isopenicillin N synthase-like dioxygenase